MVSLKFYMSRCLPLTAALLLSACTVVPYDQARPAGQPADVDQEALVVPQQPKAAIEASETPAILPAAQRMRQLASAEGDKGNYKRALVLLERALRISPRDPDTYYALAHNYLQLGNPAQALQLAQRGLSHKPDAEQRLRLEQLIERCQQKLSA